MKGSIKNNKSQTYGIAMTASLPLKKDLKGFGIFCIRN
jgi:hypothetical protein